MRQDFEYNGETSKEHGIILKDYVVRPVAEQKYTVYDIPGSDGGLYEKEDAWDPVEVVFSLMYRDSKVHANEHFRLLKQWLRDTGELRIEDIPGWHYDVLHVTLSEKSPIFMHRDEMADFTATFICKPHLYRDDGQREYSPEEVLWNPYDKCHPIYIVSGDGEFELNVNGNILKGTARGNFTIDTDLMIAYEKAYNCLIDDDEIFIADHDGALILVSDEVTEVSEYLTGDYDDMWLEEGDNTIYCTGDVTLMVIPNWRAL